MKKIAFTLLLLLATSISYADRIDPRINKDLLAIPQNAVSFLKLQKAQYRVTPNYEKKLKKNYLKHYFSPWNNPQITISKSDALKIEKSTLTHYLDKPGYNENHYPHKKAWIEKIAKNMQLNKFPNHLQKAITTQATALRVLPTIIPSFESRKIAGQGFPLDDLQNSLLTANTPIYVLQTTRSGAWQLVITPNNSLGWAQTTSVAPVSKNFIKKWQTNNFVVATTRHATVTNGRGQFFFVTRIGELFPSLKKAKRYSTVLVVVKNANGEATIKTARINTNAIKAWPILATSYHIAALANHFMGQPYGWGNLYGYHDCSSTLMDLFAPFGIWLPRNSGDQIKMGQPMPLNATQKQRKILQHGIPFFTLLHASGHIMLYIGQRNQHAYILHSPWGLITKNPTTHKMGRDIIGRTVIMPVTLGTRIPGVVTELQRINAMTTLIPRKQLHRSLDFSEQTH